MTNDARFAWLTRLIATLASVRHAHPHAALAESTHRAIERDSLPTPTESLASRTAIYKHRYVDTYDEEWGD